MNDAQGTSTDAVLRAVAERVRDLDEGELQQEVSAIQLEIQELNRQMQERQFALQLKQLAVQREQDRASGIQARVSWRPDKEVRRAVEGLHRAVESLDEQSVHQELSRLQAELQRLSWQIQERQHVLGLKQMLNQGQQAQVGVQIGMPGTLNVQWAAPQPMLLQPAGQGVARVNAATKRQAILDVMREQPGRAWKPTEVRAALTQRGIPNPDDGTPVRNLLWKMSKDGLLDRPGSGTYSLATPLTDEGENSEDDAK